MQSTMIETLTDSGDAVTVRHVRVGGTQREIGRALAAAAEVAHGPRAHPREIDPDIERVRRRWFDLHHGTQLERIRGVADHFGVDPSDSSVALDWLGTYEHGAGCSVGFYPRERTKSGHSLLSRNFDFPTATLSEIVGLPARPGELPLAADPWVVELHPDSGHASIVVGIMDVMGGMDGINAAGLSVALLADNETPDPEPTGTHQVGLSEQQVVRYMLDHCSTVDEAADALRIAKHYYFFTPCHFVVGDRSGRSFVWEHSPRRNREIVVSEGSNSEPLVCTNHLLHRWPDPTELPDDSGPVGTAALTYHCWRTLAAANASGALVDRDSIREQFTGVRFTEPVREARTFWHAIYDADDASAEISFFLHDRDGASVYTPPIRFELTR